MSSPSSKRSPWLMSGLYLIFFAVWLRLGYWQVIKGSQLQAIAEDQYTATITHTPQRGRIFTSDGFTLVDNEQVYRLFAEPQILSSSPEVVATALTPLLLAEDQVYKEATEAAVQEARQKELQQQLTDKLSKDSKWAGLFTRVSENTKKQIEALQLKGLGFDPYWVRYYPEASMAAHVTGFVGKDEHGEAIGYFGIEGALDKELRGRTTETTLQHDALGLRLLWGDDSPQLDPRGRDVQLSIRRDIQSMVEQLLAKGVEKYGAKAGEIVILEPSTGKILALAAFPRYDQATFYKYDPELYKNPSLTHTYEPGSTFKTLTVSAGIDAKVITPETQCDQCDGPRQIGKYTIKTWNNEYHPGITMTDALAKSDNVAMISIADKLGNEQFYEYLEKFGLGQQLQLDLQEDTGTPFTKKKSEIDLATNSFGQGIVTTSLQLVRAVAAIANHGLLMRPQILEKVIEPQTGKELLTPPIPERQVITPETAQQVTRMMVSAAEAGEAQWTRSATYTIAGKTGTSQIPIEGGYAPDKTIASFIGFAPADSPKFVMIVKLVEPSTSIWAAETAAPLWYQVANRLFLLLNIPPDKQL